MRAAIVAKDELIEIGVDMLAPQAVIRAQRPALQQREGAVAPGQDDVGRHIPDNARNSASVRPRTDPPSEPAQLHARPSSNTTSSGT